MDDDIQLPPLPPTGYSTYGHENMRVYARTAVLADRERREEKAKPKVHSRTLRLTDGGHVYRKHENEFSPVVATVEICWTDDGRVWIDSERNRELAQWMRAWRGQVGNEAADALDGGVR